MQYKYRITLNVSTDDMHFSKVPAIKALRQLTGMELKPALALIDIVIAAGINEPTDYYLNVSDDDAMVDNAIASFNKTGFTIEYLGDRFLDELNDLHAKAVLLDDPNAEKAILDVIDLYKR